MDAARRILKHLAWSFIRRNADCPCPRWLEFLGYLSKLGKKKLSFPPKQDP